MLDDLRDGYVTPAALQRDYGLTAAEAEQLAGEAAHG
jgi:hypothetical protein